MKKMPILLAVALLFTAGSWYSADAHTEGNQSAGQNADQNTGNTGQNTDQNTNRNADPGMPVATDGPDLIVRGTVVSTDPGTNRLTVTDYATGYERTFTVAETDVLNTVNTGDDVEVSPDQNDPNKAENVKKK